MTTPAWQALETEFRGLWPTRVDTFFDSFLHCLWTESLGFGGPCCWGVN
jgi:5-methylthioribose kinase